MNIKKYLKKPELLLYYLGMNGWFHWMPDEAYLNMIYRAHFGKAPDLKNPKTFTEKLQWLKLHDRKPEYTTMVDKYAAKQYIADRIGAEYVVPTLGVWDRFEDIDFDALPERFVLKCTHDSGGLVICRDKANLDLARAERKIRRSLSRNYYWTGREWPYQNVPPRIIAEPYLEETDPNAADHVDANIITDYKFFCFHGEPKVMYIAKDIGRGPESDYFDMDFQHLPILVNEDEYAPEKPEKPKHFEKMKQIAATLSQGIPHVRVDFYCIGDQLYVGELTFFHCSGFCRISPPEWDHKLGEWLSLAPPEEAGIHK